MSCRYLPPARTGSERSALAVRRLPRRHVPHPDVVGDGGNTRYPLYDIFGSIPVKIPVDPPGQRNRPADHPHGDVGGSFFMQRRSSASMLRLISVSGLLVIACLRRGGTRVPAATNSTDTWIRARHQFREHERECQLDFLGIIPARDLPQGGCDALHMAARTRREAGDELPDNPDFRR